MIDACLGFPAPTALLAALLVTSTWAALAARSGSTLTAAGHLLGPMLAIAIASVGVALVDGCGEKACLFLTLTRMEAARLEATLVGAAALAAAGARRHAAIVLPSAACWVAAAGVLHGLGSASAALVVASAVAATGALASLVRAMTMVARRDRVSGSWLALCRHSWALALGGVGLGCAVRVAAAYAHEAALHGP